MRKMSKQVLTVEQMQHLQEMGLELNPTILCYKRNKLVDDATWFLDVRIDRPSNVFEEIPAYTLQDILDVSPKMISVENEYWLEISMEDDEHWSVCCRECDTDKQTTLVYVYDEELIDAAYRLLCWCIENGHVETNRIL